MSLAYLIHRLRSVALPPGYLAPHVPDGVLRALGFAAWEMPLDVTRGGGYHNRLRLEDGAAWFANLSAAAQAQADVLDDLDVDDLRAQLFNDVAMDLTTDPVTFGTRYGPGDSITYQNLVYAPTVEAGAGTDGVGDWVDQDYAEDATGVELAEGESLEVWGNIGVANNSLFWTGTRAFSALYGLQSRDYTYVPLGFHPNNPWFAYLEGGIPAPSHRDYVTLATFFGILDRFGVPAVGIKFFPHIQLDPYHPQVVRFLRQHIAAMARVYGDRVRFVMPGEFGSMQRFAPSSACDVPAWEFNCVNCEPKTPFGHLHVPGFRVWCKNKYDTIAALNATWGTSLTSFEEIDPEVLHRCGAAVPVPYATQDWIWYQSFLSQELIVQHYVAAKMAKPFGQLMRTLGFHDAGMERSWLRSDGPAAGDFYSTEADYFDYATNVLPPNRLYRFSACAKLSGVPVAWAMTAPPSPPHTITRTPAQMFPKTRLYTRNNVDMLIHDCMNSAVINFGYRREGGWGFESNATSLAATTDAMAAWQARRTEDLRFMTPWSRIAVHVEDLDLLRFPGWPSHSAEFSRHMISLIQDENLEMAVFSDRSILDRCFSRAQLRRHCTIVPFPQTDLDGLLADYVDLLTNDEGKVYGSAIVLLSSAQIAGLTLPETSRSITIGSGTLIQWRPQVRLFLWDGGVLPSDPRGQAFYGTAAATILDVLRNARLGQLWTNSPKPVVAQPDPSIGRIHMTYVSDGLGFLVSVARMENTGLLAQPVSLTMDAEWEAAIGLTHTIDGGGLITLDPGQVKQVRVFADVSFDNAEIAPLIAAIRSFLTTLSAQFDTSVHEAGLDRIEEMAAVPAHDSRIAAAFVTLFSLPLLLVDRAGPEVYVAAGRLTISKDGELGVQHLVRPEVTVTIPALGNYQLPRVVGGLLGAARVKLDVSDAPSRWDFETFTLDDKFEDVDLASTPVVVMVTDPATSATAYKIVK